MTRLSSRGAVGIKAVFSGGFRVPSLLSLTLPALLLPAAVALVISIAVTADTCAAQTIAPSASEQEPTAQTSQDLRLHVESNLVIVRALVRDAQGRPVENLKKEDFRLFDKGKEQTITQFDAISSPAQPLTVPSSAKSDHSSSTVTVSTPDRPSFVALYFDDLNTSDADMMQARDAADSYLGSRLPGNQRVGIFTSRSTLSEFTADPKQIHDALAKLHASPRGLTRIHDCPELSDYQAMQITRSSGNPTIDAWKMAIDEAMNRCGMVNDPKARDVLMQMISGVNVDSSLPEVQFVLDAIRSLARTIAAQAETLTRSNLQELQQLVTHLSQMPGQRTIVLISPGFLTDSEQLEVDEIVDRALRMQVVVSSLDAKGFALLMRESDVTRAYAAAASSGVIGATHGVDTMREAASTDVLTELASGTGGEFFHNSNDLKAGFDALAGESVYYILAFVPKKLDGKFHKLQVKLTRSQGRVTTRQGYFAVKNEPNLSDTP